MKTPARSVSPNSPRRVLLVGWDAADWQMIHPLVDRGLMPTLEQMMNRGVWGNLATLRPILSPMLWNSIATGKRAEQHGVHGFTEPDPEGAGIRPVQSTSRRVKALWNMLTHAGLRSHVVGWYASHPTEPIQGTMVSNQFEQFRLEAGVPTPPPSRSVHPVERTSELAPLRVGAHEIDATAILPFIPNAQKLLDNEGHRLGKLQHLLAQTATVHAAATHLLTQDDWDFAAVYYEGIDRFGHEFMEFHPPKMEQVSAEDFEAYQHCMVGAYRFHDMMLQTLLDLVGDDTAVLLISDHGYYNDHLRPDPREGQSGPVEWHRPFGVFAAQGPGIQEGSRLYGAGLLDIAPTVLQLLGLPAAYDMPGRVLAEILQETTPLPRIESWEEISGECGLHPAEMRIDPVESRAALEQLVALGYVEAPSEDSEQTVRDTIANNRFNLIQSLVDSQQYAAAIALLDELDPALRDTTAAQTLLASCLLGVGDRGRARVVLGQLAEQATDSARAHMMLGTLEFADGDTEAAMEHFRQVVESSPRLPGLHNKLGAVLLETGRYAEAIDAFEKALAIDGDSPLAFTGRARAKLELGDPQAALDDAMIAAELVHHLPRAHYLIGRALSQLGKPNDAAEALELCVKQAPGMKVAHEALARVYHDLGHAERARDAELRAKRILAN
ncbi:alkaline phosphatase family protein [Botrimarina hoheduenensis]|uniref:Tetratricopeptide repeat protein n=1 Tax=Botrimarina hoheduenensis TaxID=2528000 RepID=A0A5C5WA66_9BACT|nr:alkaline phosphatase family protein [Botrimarina hoheduenensis]TWT47550.1 tetratricopeptide repeat protein [Botrimarina hoheduenensis]